MGKFWVNGNRPIIKMITGLLTVLFLAGCTVSGYIADPASIAQQKKLHNLRTGVTLGEGALITASAVGALFTGVAVYPGGQLQQFKKIQITSESKDTLFVNMVTDYQRKDSSYCDIRNIVLPPKKSLKVVVPNNATYNVYYRTDFSDPKDEQLEVNTLGLRRLKLRPEHEK